MRLIPRPHPNGTGFILNFRHPLRGKPVCVGLGTDDELTANAICVDLRALFHQPEILQGPPWSPKILAYERRAVEIALGKEAAQVIFDHQPESPLSETEIDHVGAAVVRARTIAAKDVEQAKTRGDENAAPFYMAWRDELQDKMKGFTPEAHRRLQERVTELEKIVKVQSAELDSLRAENVRLRRQHNVDVKVTIADAVKTWAAIASEGRKPTTVHEWITALNSFVEALPEKGRTRLGAVDSRMVDGWMENLKGQGGEQLAPMTKRNRRNGVSVFFRWAVSKYKLVDNPVNKTLPITGLTRTPEQIAAIRRVVDLREFLVSLESWPYWLAWCTVAIFAGPRFREQCYLKLDDVYLDDDGDFIRIATRASGRHAVGTKTGRERRIPIELTMLKPVLKAYVVWRKKEQRQGGATDAQKSEWLFPTVVPDGSIARTKTEAGIWSSNRVFLDAWNVVAAAAWREHSGAAADAVPAGVWTFGPREWRHTFGTVLGNCGWGPLEIARVMGNSPNVAERHYVASVSHGRDRRWPFKW